MDALTLVLVFSAAVAISGGVVLLFSPVIDTAVRRVLSPELASVWTAYAKFAAFVAGLAGGLGSSGIETVVAMARTEELTPGRGVLAVLQTAQGSLEGGSWSLLLILGSALAAAAGRELLESVRRPRREPGPVSRSHEGRAREERAAAISGQAPL